MPDDIKPNLTKGEKIFVGGLAVSILAVSTGFVIATIGWGLPFPGVYIAIALGICIAAIVYAFLGGVAGTEFSVGTGVKFAGSLAAIVGVYYVFSGPLQTSMNDAQAVAVGKAAESTIQQEQQKALDEHAARLRAEQKVQELQSQAGITQSDTDAGVLARIRQSSADDDLGRGVIGIFRNHQGPFRTQTMKLQRHQLGSKSRLALEILLWTGQRLGDAHRFGPTHVREGRINYEQEKGGKELWLPMAPQLRAAIDAMPAVGVQTFLVTEYGKPFSKKGFGNWFRDRCDEAGLNHCSAHGLRKAIARRLAENDATQPMIKSVGGWSNDREVAIYTAAAEQAKLAKTALTALSEWEAQTLGQD